MPIAELILKYIEALVYPALVVFALIFFRRQFARLLEGRLTAK